ncbi:MAG: ABC transporter ATP-binding protein [Pirellulales bacterium]|nr:ABC transporter ATP-binding protein [Pirellulales bacterium]
MLAISTRNLVKTYPSKPPVEAVRGLDLAVERGECFGLLGPNGAGKTTTIEILEGLLPATSGDVEILGLRWGRDDDAIRQQVGISLQETKLSEKLTVLETITLFRSFYRQGMDPLEALNRVSLQEKAQARVGKLSGGQKQRLAVACAIAGDPQLLFLDEPTTGLDPASRRELWEIIRGFRAAGRTILLTTHYMDEAEKLCDRIAIVDHGRVIALGTPRELIASLGGEHIIEFHLLGQHGEASLPRERLAALQPLLSRLPSVSQATVGDAGVRLSAAEFHRVLPALVNTLASEGYELANLSTHHASLEDVFISLAGRKLAEE